MALPRHACSWSGPVGTCMFYVAAAPSLVAPPHPPPPAVLTVYTHVLQGRGGVPGEGWAGPAGCASLSCVGPRLVGAFAGYSSPVFSLHFGQSVLKAGEAGSPIQASLARRWPKAAGDSTRGATCLPWVNS